jgi:hypothetical protein
MSPREVCRCCCATDEPVAPDACSSYRSVTVIHKLKRCERRSRAQVPGPLVALSAAASAPYNVAVGANLGLISSPAKGPDQAHPGLDGLRAIMG